MKALFARGGGLAPEVAARAREPLLVALDFDGTLAPIVGDRDRAEMRARTAALLAELAAACPIAIVSGRSRADVAARVRGAPVRFVVGNHGVEPGPVAVLRRCAREAARARDLLVRALAGRPGIDVEDKGASLSIHFRHAPDKAAARRAIGRALAALPVAVRQVAGKDVVNVVPAGAPDKGDAVERLARAARARAVLYVGDDVTDEDVFARADGHRLIGVRVGRAARSRAGWYLRDQREIDQLLAALAALRTTGASGRPRASGDRPRAAAPRAARAGRRGRGDGRTRGSSRSRRRRRRP
ncbi:MAG TPA: trehalose-phosphatase [Kofleriaceae bacterium]|nr:trehalose-phosphatase [Kofleriaceae bacterium]